MRVTERRAEVKPTARANIRTASELENIFMHTQNSHGIELKRNGTMSCPLQTFTCAIFKRFYAIFRHFDASLMP